MLPLRIIVMGMVASCLALSGCKKDLGPAVRSQIEVSKNSVAIGKNLALADGWAKSGTSLAHALSLCGAPTDVTDSMALAFAPYDSLARRAIAWNRFCVAHAGTYAQSAGEDYFRLYMEADLRLLGKIYKQNDRWKVEKRFAASLARAIAEQGAMGLGPVLAANQKEMHASGSEAGPGFIAKLEWDRSKVGFLRASGPPGTCVYPTQDDFDKTELFGSHSFACGEREFGATEVHSERGADLDGDGGLGLILRGAGVAAHIVYTRHYLSKPARQNGLIKFIEEETELSCVG